MKPHLDTQTMAYWPSLQGRMRNVLQLCEEHGCDASHAFRVADLALQIHDQLYYRHRAGAQSRELVASAALLHDIGLRDGYAGHHTRARDIIMRARLRGFSDREQSIIAQTVRYHRQAIPSLKHEGFSDLHMADRKIVMHLAAVVRLADGLDCNGRGVVEDITLRPGGGGMKMIATTCGKADEEIETASRKADLFEQLYGTLIITTVAGE